MESNAALLWLGEFAVKGGILMALAIVILLLGVRRGAGRHLIATLALVSVLSLPILSLVLPGWHLPDYPKAESMVERTVSINEIHPKTSRTETRMNRSAVAPRPNDVPQSSPLPSRSQATAKPRPWPNILLAIWVLGGGLSLGYRLLGWWAVARLRRHSLDDMDSVSVALLRTAKERFGLSRKVSLRRSGAISTPITFGTFRPMILVPNSWPNWSERRKQSVLVHELAHIKRFDDFTQMIGQIACATQWFNPLSWCLLRQMELNREYACDDLTLAAGVGPADYAETLLQVTHGDRNPRITSATVAVARPSTVEQRIRRVLRPGRTRKVLTIATVLLAIGGCAFVLLPLASMRPGTERHESRKPNPTLLAARKAGKPNAT